MPKVKGAWHYVINPVDGRRQMHEGPRDDCKYCNDEYLEMFVTGIVTIGIITMMLIHNPEYFEQLLREAVTDG